MNWLPDLELGRVDAKKKEEGTREWWMEYKVKENIILRIQERRVDKISKMADSNGMMMYTATDDSFRSLSSFSWAPVSPFRSQSAFHSFTQPTLASWSQALRCPLPASKQKPNDFGGGISTYAKSDDENVIFTRQLK
jgi:hypothetical protein